MVVVEGKILNLSLLKIEIFMFFNLKIFQNYTLLIDSILKREFQFQNNEFTIIFMPPRSNRLLLSVKSVLHGWMNEVLFRFY